MEEDMNISENEKTENGESVTAKSEKDGAVKKSRTAKSEKDGTVKKSRTAKSEKDGAVEKSRTAKSEKDGENAKERELKPLKEAARRIALMLCEFSADRELFVSDGTPERRLDTKSLKEFSAVLKEVSAVVSELNGDGADIRGAVHIEFSDDALDMSS